jgi:hypothetical protein
MLKAHVKKHTNSKKKNKLFLQLIWKFIRTSAPIKLDETFYHFISINKHPEFQFKEYRCTTLFNENPSKKLSLKNFFMVNMPKYGTKESLQSE